jgi:DNA-directed RNA polymerase subunit M/transcription elongation factor TFIIS
MSVLCNICGNLLTNSTSAESFLFICNKCSTTTKPSDKDTLRYEDVTGTDLIVYKAILLNAGQDPVNPKVKKQCSCGYNIVKQVRLGREMKLINTCIKCNNQWLDGTLDTDSKVDF